MYAHLATDRSTIFKVYSVISVNVDTIFLWSMELKGIILEVWADCLHLLRHLDVDIYFSPKNIWDIDISNLLLAVDWAGSTSSFDSQDPWTGSNRTADTTCEFCGKTFTCKASCSDHKNAVHLFQYNYPCDFCGKVFLYKRTKRRHQLTCSVRSLPFAYDSKQFHLL